MAAKPLEDPVEPASSQAAPPAHDPHRAVIRLLLALSAAGTLVAFCASFVVPSLMEAAAALVLATGILLGVSKAQAARVRARSAAQPGQEPLPLPLPMAAAEAAPSDTAPVTEAAPPASSSHPREYIAGAGVVAIAIVLLTDPSAVPVTPMAAALAAAFCLAASALAATAARYLASVEPEQLPEAPGLARGARVLAWLLGLTAVSAALSLAQLPELQRGLHLITPVIGAAVCVGLMRSRDQRADRFDLELGVLDALGRRPNVLASLLDAAERQLGIDLRSSWALTVVRRSLEPLLLGLCLLGWLSTSCTVIGVEQEGLVERLGVTLRGAPLQPGLHVHWPWPVDRVLRIPVRRVQTLTVGHEGEAESGPENVLWARQHAEDEYTLLLGDGRDLITIDAAAQFRITDARAFAYHCQNPEDALRAVAHRAVMRFTVNRTLADALSENVATLTGRMRAAMQADADALGLGVEVVGFSVGGMHPPVAVARSYQAVVSAELGKVTAIVEAQGYRNQTVPAAEAAIIAGENGARAEGAEALARAAGEAWSFRTLEAQYAVAPEEFRFRRRLEALEGSLSGLRFTVVDDRILRDGGGLWLTQ